MAKKVHRYVVKPRTKKAMENGLKTTQGRVSFDGKTQKILTDPTLASEIDSQYGLKGKANDVYVYQDERLEWHDSNDKDTDGVDRLSGGHRYFFANSSRSYQNNYDRIFRTGKKVKHAGKDNQNKKRKVQGLDPARNQSQSDHQEQGSETKESVERRRTRMETQREVGKP